MFLKDATQRDHHSVTIIDSPAIFHDKIQTILREFCGLPKRHYYCELNYQVLKKPMS